MPKKPKKRRRPTAASAQPAAEERRAEILTVAWMLATVATLTAEVGGVIARLVLANMETDQLAPTAAAIPGLMLFTAMVTGGVSLALTPAVYWLRRVPPPTVVTAFAVTVCVVPYVIVVINSWRAA